MSTVNSGQLHQVSLRAPCWMVWENKGKMWLAVGTTNAQLFGNGAIPLCHKREPRYNPAPQRVFFFPNIRWHFDVIPEHSKMIRLQLSSLLNSLYQRMWVIHPFSTLKGCTCWYCPYPKPFFSLDPQLFSFFSHPYFRDLPSGHLT